VILGKFVLTNNWVVSVPIPSCRLRRPAPLGRQILGPAWAAVGEVITVTDQTLMELAGKQGDVVRVLMRRLLLAWHDSISS